MSTHTPGPWFQGQIKGTEHQIFTNEAGVFIDDDEANPADIAFIVRACNSHEAMLEALKRTRIYLSSSYSEPCTHLINEIDDLIAKAEGRA